MILLSQEAIIAEEKLTQYLLVSLPKDDKSKFLAQAGYTLENWQQLEKDLRTQVLTQPAKFIEKNRYGEKYLIRASLRGVNGVELNILSIWMVTDSTTRFVTLVPSKGVDA
ncbi:hypothetical protein H6G89_17045 [Oscillatoria sp. FACHB-1407]|uniref:DUF6883 domain-containing protein n=1 Tax=Oscillatoria sp. FACHB-1407 TaxID=2692847 RepID=UPI0016896578|nr:DUF6883 domain-containing protein [Oscillatoria sp. FACHB-1407]MBD2462749.1 hypothetical protein [Oscillatoria sp. FACHB-1407]